MRTLIVASFLLVIIAVGAISQQADAVKLTGPYLGQNPPGSVPIVFAPGVVSTEKGWEAAISFSPDLRELFFTRRLSIEGMENRILHMKMNNNEWTKPVLASFARDIMEYEAFITPDYRRVIFNSARANPKSAKGGVWYSERENDSWSEARFFPGSINEGWIMSVTSTLDATLYFTANYGDGYGIYRSRFINGAYTKPEFLPKEINKSRYFGASHPYIAPDESYLIFDAGATKNSDLYISYKKEDGSWTDAIPFGQTINTKDHENIATVSPDGKYLFFGRDNDIYWVSSRIIEELRPKQRRKEN